MALQKDIELPSGDTGDYLKIGYIHIDFRTKEASIHFDLYKSKEHRDTGKAMQRPVTAKLRLERELFDKYYASAAMNGKNHVQQAYLAAKQEKVISDWGETVFHDAVDV